MMNVLNSLKKDLLGRRLLPFVILAVVVLAGGVAYAVLGGGGSSSPSSVASVAPALPPAPTTVATAAPANPNVAVSETTSGASHQSSGATRDPFVPLPQPKSKTTSATGATPSSSSSSSTTSSSGAGSSSGSKSSSGAGSGGSTPTTPTTTPTPTTPSPTPAPKKSPPVYEVALLFGLAPPAGQNPQLTPYEHLMSLTLLPSKQNQLLAYSGVGPTGKGALFTLLQPAILKGPGTCLPSTTQCERLDLEAGKTEELSYVGETGQPTVYQLQVVSIVKKEASAHTATARASNTLGAHAATDHRRRVSRSRADLHRRGPAGGSSAAR